MKLRLLFLLTITSISLNAQHKWFVGLTFRPDVGSRKLVSEGQNADLIISMRNDIETPRLCFSAGLAVKHHLKPHLTLESGLYISDKGYQTMEIPVTTIQNPDPSINSDKMRFVYHQYYLDIPLIAHYRNSFKDAWFYNAGAGICNSFFTDQYVNNIMTLKNGSLERYKTSDKDRVNYEKYIISGVITAGIGRHINDKISLGIEARGQYNLSPSYSGQTINEHFWNIGLNISAWWRL